jgi:hypothetical protein
MIERGLIITGSDAELLNRALSVTFLGECGN